MALTLMIHGCVVMQGLIKLLHQETQVGVASVQEHWVLTNNHLLTDFDVATGKVIAINLVAYWKCFWDVIILETAETENT